MRIAKVLAVGAVLIAGGAASLCSGLAPAKQETVPTALPLPLGLPDLTYPKNNPYNPAVVALGKQLYFDARLSSDNTISCASCHDPSKGWSNGEPFATGIRGQKGGRNAPTIINAAYQRFQFWDGRAEELEGQALGPIQNPIEMGMDIKELCAKLDKIKGYRDQFQSLFGTGATPEAIARSIAAFERTLLSGNTPFDRYKSGDKAALSPKARAGYEIFFNKAHCSACHTGGNLSDGAFHNIGVGMDKDKPDAGREAITKVEGDRGSFRTPTLREIARSAPYMHDGSLATLEDVVNYYDKGGTPNDYLDEEIYPLKLTAEDKDALVTFLKEGLASPDYPQVQAPKLPE